MLSSMVTKNASLSYFPSMAPKQGYQLRCACSQVTTSRQVLRVRSRPGKGLQGRLGSQRLFPMQESMQEFPVRPCPGVSGQADN